MFSRFPAKSSSEAANLAPAGCFDAAQIAIFDSLSPSALQHTYSSVRSFGGRALEFEKASKIISTIQSTFKEEFARIFEKPFHSLVMDRKQEEWSKNYFYQHASFNDALELLQIPASQHRSIVLPWWNEIACSEASFSYGEAGNLIAHLEPRHSYETQLTRLEIPRGILNASVAGVVLCTDDQDPSISKIMLGRRGGLHFRNTLYFPAGALKATDQLRRGESSIAKTFEGVELIPETGLKLSGIPSAKMFFHSRTRDLLVDRGVSYNFSVHLGLSESKLRAIWEANRHPDKKEHEEILFVRLTKPDVWAFLEKHYRGIVRNDPERKAENPPLLHSAAILMAASVGIPLRNLEALFQIER